MKWFLAIVASYGVLLSASFSMAQNSPSQPPSGSSSDHQTPRDNRTSAPINEFGDDEQIEGRRLWSVWAESYNEVLASSLNRREFRSDVKYSDGLSTNWFGLDYELGSDWTAEVAQEWESYWGLGTNSAYTQLNDTYLQMGNSKLFTIGRDIEAESYLRVYVPTGQDSRDMGQMLRLRYELATAKIFSGNMKLKYVLRPEIYFQKYLSYYDRIEKEIMGTKQFEFWNLVDFEWKALRHLTFHQVVGLRDIFRYSDPNYEVSSGREEDFVGDTALVYEPSDSLSIRGGIYEEDMNLFDQHRSFQPYREDEVSYYVSAEVSY